MLRQASVEEILASYNDRAPLSEASTIPAPWYVDPRIAEVAADKGYSSRANLKAVADVGGVAYIPFKSNAQPGEGLWGKAFHFFFASCGTQLQFADQGRVVVELHVAVGGDLQEPLVKCLLDLGR